MTEMTEWEFIRQLRVFRESHQLSFFAGKNAAAEFIRLGFSQDQADSVALTVRGLFQDDLKLFDAIDAMREAWRNHNRLGLPKPRVGQSVGLGDAEV